MRKGRVISHPPFTHAARRTAVGMFVVLRRFRDHDFRREQQARNRRRVLQREARDLRRIWVGAAPSPHEEKGPSIPLPEPSFKFNRGDPNQQERARSRSQTQLS